MSYPSELVDGPVTGQNGHKPERPHFATKTATLTTKTATLATKTATPAATLHYQNGHTLCILNLSYCVNKFEYLTIDIFPDVGPIQILSQKYQISHNYLPNIGY